MRYQKITFTNKTKHNSSKLGGLPWIDTHADWPRDPETGSDLLLLLTLENSLLTNLFPEMSIPDSHCVSVFVGFDPLSRACARRLTIHEQADRPKLKTSPSKVISHKKSTRPCAAASGVSPLTEMAISISSVKTEEVDSDMPDRGTVFSKVGGIPGWAQDPIRIPKQTYVLQLSESDFWPYSRAHAGILGGGTGFLFLKNTQKRGLGEIGSFFIQFS